MAENQSKLVVTLLIVNTVLLAFIVLSAWCPAMKSGYCPTKDKSGMCPLTKGSVSQMPAAGMEQ